MRKGSYLVALFLIFLCFALGCLSILLPPDPDHPSQQANIRSALPEHPIVEMPHDEKIASVLILGVDRIQNPNPDLIAVWLATVRDSSKDVSLLGFPIHLGVGGEGSTSLQNLFTFNRQAGVSNDFMQAFNTINTLRKPETIIVIDETMFASLVDYVGGVHVGDTVLTGESVVSFQRLLYDDPHGLLISQLRVLENLRPQLKELEAPIDVTTLLILSKEHAYISMESFKLALWMSTFLPADPKGIRVEVIDSGAMSSSALMLP